MMSENQIQECLKRGAVFYYELLEYPIAVGTTTVVQIQNEQLLTGARIFDLETFTSDDLTVSPLNNPLVTLAQLKTGYFSGYASDPTTPFVPASGVSNNQGLWLAPIPLVSMHKLQSNTDTFARRGFPLAGNSTIYWGQSKFLFPGGLTISGVPASILLGVSYMLFPNNPTN